MIRAHRFRWFVLVQIGVALFASTIALAQSDNGAGTPPANEVKQPQLLSKHELFSEDNIGDVIAIESVWSSYVYCNDSHNDLGIASLFTENAVIQFVWNNYGKLVPTFGIDPYQTPDGPNGSGCVLTGCKQFAQNFGYNRDVNNQPLAVPGLTHHFTTNKMVKVNADGKTAMLTAAWLTTAVAKDHTVRVGGTGSYRVFLSKTADGWEISEMYGISDAPSGGNTACDLHGPIARPHD